MKRHRTLASLLGLPSLLLLVVPLWHYLAAQEASPDSATADTETTIVTTNTLGGDERYLTHLSTDKPIYRVGEIVYVRGVLLHHANRHAVPTDKQIQAVVEIRGPKGDVVASGMVTVEESVLGFGWTVPDAQPGGQYTAKVTYPFSGHPPAERSFDIRAYRAPRLKTQIEFVRDGYGPGDQVAAILHVERAEGGVPASAPVTVTARLDGEEVYRGTSSVNASGDCVGRFTLPAEITRGEGTLAMAIQDGGVVETASKTIPILLQTVDLTLYPEGGDLVADLPNRVYFQAFTPAHKPADLAGVVVDQNGTQVATFRSEHEGRGRFQFSPQDGHTYALKIIEPSGIDTQYALPDVVSRGVALRADRDQFAANQPITLGIGCTPQPRDLRVTLAKRETVVAEGVLPASEQTAKALTGVKFDLEKEAPDGVLIATVWDADGTPLAERLVYRQPAQMVHVEISPNASQYVPGDKARITLRTTDDAGEPVDAVVGVTVTDDSVLEMIERREQAPRLPVMVLLEDEVRELADAHVYLDPNDPEAPRAVDLLLGTQGWRKFAFVHASQFLAEYGDAARRVLSLRMASRTESLSFGVGMRGLGLAKGAVDELDAVMLNAEMAPEAMLRGQDRKANDRFAPPAAAEPAAGPAPVVDQQREQAAKSEIVAVDEAKQLAQSVARRRLAKALEDADAIADRELMAEEQVQLRNDFVAVRLYAHQVSSTRQPGARTDFTETLFWHAGIRTGKEGTATIEFGLNDSVGSFRVLADAFTADGALGSNTRQIDSVEPFYLEPKLPLEVTMDDVIHAPIGVVNATNTQLFGTNIRIAGNAGQPFTGAITSFDLAPGERTRRMMRIRVGQFSGRAEFTLSATAGPYGDQVTRSVAVKPLGFPVEDGVGGLIGPESDVSHEFTIPEDIVRDSLSARIIAHPTPLASMTEALERLIREPCGCFEQTSSSTYPLVMAQQYFLSHTGIDPSLIERSAEILERGYSRLTGFESPSGGYEWFGGDPGHDALTAYGLLEFTDMARVRHVDPAMLARTRAWLLDQRDGEGGYVRRTHTLHTWLAEPDVANTYNTWALLEAGVDSDLSKEVAWVRQAAETTQNTYVMALAANVLALAGDREGADHLWDRLAGEQTDDGSLSGATVSVVGSTGQALKIETTALAVLAWLKNPQYAENVERSIQYLAESCKAGRYGSTQSTVLALRAIIAYDQSRAVPKAPGSLQVTVDGKAIGSPVAFTPETQGAIELPDIAKLMAAGQHQVQIAMTGGSQMPYSVTLEYHRKKPDSSDQCKLYLDVALRDMEVVEGNVTEAQVAIVNRVGETLPMPVAIIGIPGGLEVRHDQLKELVKQQTIAAYEVVGREVVLYWRALQPEERVELPISLVAAIPGTYTGPASRAYQYYTDEDKVWLEGLHVSIDRKPEGNR